MTTEQVAASEVEQNEVNAEEQAAFLAEMAEDSDADVQAPAIDSESKSSEEGTGDAASQDAEPQAQAERKEVIAGYTEEEIRSALESVNKLQKALDTTNGTYGARLAEQQKLIEQLSQRNQQALGAISKEKFAKLSAEFPELAELLADDLSGIIGQVGGGGFDPAQVEQAVLPKAEALIEERLAKAEQAREIRSLTKRHNDWREVAMFTVSNEGQVAWNNPQFGVFVKGLPEEEQRMLVESFDADFVAEKLTQFKESQKRASQPRKKVELESTLIHPGSGGAPRGANPLDEEEAAFRAEMAKG